MNQKKCNLNYLFSTGYYDKFEHTHFDKCNNALTGYCFEQADEIHGDFTSLELKTVYPGLLIGIGNPHETGTEIKGTDEDGTEIKLGFTLDYVTGLPTIPGSTVKGVLRSAFNHYPTAIANFLGIDEEDVKDVKNITFGDPEKGKCVFFDAIIVNSGKDSHILGLDYITPHKSKKPGLDGLTNPIPLAILKVIPNVTFLFRFDLSRFESDKISKEKLMSLFENILTNLGIGAKTNVGYGVMKSIIGTCTVCGSETKPIKKLLDQGIKKYHEKCSSCANK